MFLVSFLRDQATTHLWPAWSSIGKGLSLGGLVRSFFFSLCRLSSLLFLVWSQRLLSETRAFLGSLGLSFYRWEGLLPNTVINAMSILRDSNERSHLLFGF